MSLALPRLRRLLCWPQKLLLLSAVIALAAVTACSGPQSAEEEIREFLDTVEEAVEGGRIREVRSHIADNYSDKEGRSKQDLLNMLVYHTVRQRSIHLFTKVRSIRVTEAETAEVELLTAMTGRAADSPAMLVDLRGDVYQFRFILQRDKGDWQLAHASWQPGSLADLAPQP